MKRTLVALVLTLASAVGATAQKPSPSFPRPTWGVPRQPEHTIAEMVVVREKLIKHYTALGGLGKTNGLAWGVSICGDEDIFNGDESSWLTVYVYQDKLNDFTLDFDSYVKRVNGIPKVDGITVMVEVIKRPKQGAKNEQPKTERNDRQPLSKNGRSKPVVSGRPSRA